MATALPTLLKRKALADQSVVGQLERPKEKRVKASIPVAQKKQEKVQRLAAEYQADYARGHLAEDAPFVGAQPKVLRKPEIASSVATARSTAVALRTIGRLVEAAHGVHIIFGQDSSSSATVKSLLHVAVDEDVPEASPVMVGLGADWLNTLPFTEAPRHAPTGGRLLIYVGTPGKYLSMCLRSSRARLEEAYGQNRLVVLCRGVCMLPLGAQEQNIFGVDSDAILAGIAAAARGKGELSWAHGAGTKASLMQRAFGYPLVAPLPAPVAFRAAGSDCETGWCCLTEFVRYLNKVKQAKPAMPVLNWYDTGLLVSVLQGSVAEAGVSLLTDGDGLAMLREASMGHVISKLNQVIAVEPYSTTKGVYNFFVGDGACRLNGGVELALHLMEGYEAQSMTTLWVFNNQKWALEDNLVAGTEREHALYNTDFYNLLTRHGRVAICENEHDVREVVTFLSKKTDLYLRGESPPGLSIVVVRGLQVALPPMLGDLGPVARSPEMAFLRRVLGKFAEGCSSRIPLYGCSAFEYIQYLHVFMDGMPEGKRYQYVCGRTDIQAAQLCGFRQPEGRCVLFISDVYGINSLGESLRSILSGFGGKQLLLFIWHPSLVSLWDHFHLHRPPLVWPSVGPNLAKFFVRTERDALFVDYEGGSSAEEVTESVLKGLASRTPLVCVNMLPEQERDYVSLDIRAKTA